jgi:hypothetical protein
MNSSAATSFRATARHAAHHDGRFFLKLAREFALRHQTPESLSRSPDAFRKAFSRGSI